LEVFNAVGETVAVLVVEESKINLVKENEILHLRRFNKVAAICLTGDVKKQIKLWPKR